MAENPKDYTEHYPSDVSDLEWEFCASYLTLMKPEAPQRRPLVKRQRLIVQLSIRSGNAVATTGTKSIDCKL